VLLPRAHAEEVDGFVLDLFECLEGQHGHRLVDGATVARAKHSVHGLGALQRRLQQTLLGRQVVHGVADAPALYELGAHLGDHVAQPAGVDPAAGSAAGVKVHLA
jgi:hypothetical protein